MDVDKYPPPPKYFVYLIEDTTGAGMDFYNICRSERTYRLPDDDDPKCIYRGDDYNKALRLVRLKNSELDAMRLKQTLNLNL